MEAVERTAVRHQVLPLLLERLPHRFVRHPPAHDAPRVGVDDERDVDEPGPGRDAAQIGEPPRVRPRRPELPVDPVRRARILRHRRRLHPPAPHHAAKAERAHQRRHRAPGRHDALALELAPHLAHPIDPEVLLPHPLDLLAELAVAASLHRTPTLVDLPGLALVVRRWGDRQPCADRLDPVHTAVGVDERRHVLGRRSSSAWANYADALRRIPFARRSSRFSRSSV